MNTLRNSHGHWLPGVSGNPAGRPKGARDKRRRYRFNDVRTWPCEKNLGHYAVTGGPGRPKGTKNRRKDARAIYQRAEALRRAMRRGMFQDSTLGIMCALADITSDLCKLGRQDGFFGPHTTDS